MMDICMLLYPGVKYQGNAISAAEDLQLCKMYIRSCNRADEW